MAFESGLQMMFARETQRALHRQHLTQRQLARRAGISDGYVTQLLSGTTAGALGTWSKIFDALSISVTLTQPERDEIDS